MNTNSYIRYGEAFKRQVVDEIESGKHSGAGAAAKVYAIKGSTTVSKWLRKYGKEHLIPKEIRITDVKERDEKKELKKRVRELEKALADAHMSGLLGDSYLEIACEQLDVDLHSFKKKHVTKLSNAPKGRGIK